MDDLMRDIAAHRDATAFLRLFDLFAPKIKGYMMQRGADDALAEILTHETLFAVWRRAALLPTSTEHLATWIFTAARNIGIARISQETAWQQLSDVQLKAAMAGNSADRKPKPNEIAANVELALAELPTDQRDVLALCFIQGLSHSEVAAQLDIPVDSVKARMRLAYLSVRSVLEPVGQS
jgi:RNA polymerase sigma-70 factor, ECF subfamily